MNKESFPHPYEPVSADERWIDAALSEHARLGRDGADEEMILRILSETVHRPSPSVQRPHARSSRFFSLPFTASAFAAAAAFGILLAGLASLRTSSKVRQSEELRFVVHLPTPLSVTERAPAAIPEAVIASRLVTLQPAGFHLAITPSDSFASPNSPEIVTEFGPTFTDWPRDTSRDEKLRIVADQRDSSPDGQSFRGDVVVVHDQFRIEADVVEVAISGGDLLTRKTPLLARRVRVSQPGVGCEAEAEILSYDPVTEALVLTGVSRVTTERGELDHFNPGDRLVISPSGFSVETTPVEIHASPPLLKR